MQEFNEILKSSKEKVKIEEMITGNYNIKNHSTSIEVNPCPICGHKNDFFIRKKNNTFKCFRNDISGSVIDFIMHFEGLDKSSAIKKIINLTDGDYKFKKPTKKSRLISLDNPKMLDKRIDKQIEIFFHNVTIMYKLFRDASYLITQETNYYEIMFVILHRDFFDRICDIFIYQEKESKIQTIKNIENQYNMQVVTTLNMIRR